MKKIKHLIKLISIIVLFMAPASCDLVTELITIENAVNVGSCHINLTYRSAMNVTNVAGVDFDDIDSNLEHRSEGWVRIGAFQTDNPGLDGDIILANVTFNKTADVSDICSLIGITVITLTDATPYPQDNPITYAVDGCTIVVSAPPTTTPTDPNDDEDDGGGGGGIIHTPTPSPAPTASPVTPSAATTPVRGESPAKTTAPTPTPALTTPSLPPLILSPIAAIIIVMILTVFGIIRVLGITAPAKDETHTEAIASIRIVECKKAITAIVGIVVVAVAAIIAIILMM